MRAPIGPLKLCHRWKALILYWITLLTLIQSKVVNGTTETRYSSRIVETKTGSVRGILVELNSRYLEQVEVFRSIPYAKPPIGKLRFELPQPLEPWKGIKLAENFASVCPQSFPDIGNRTAALMYMPKGRYQYLKKFLPVLQNQSEDCLHLNIYVPASGNRGIDAPYAVVFYIHGESYEWGSGNPYDGSVLASYGHVIVITINYRLGILGFLKTRASSTPGTSGGNLGLMDIIAALQWTKDNIASFGGDPSRIIIVGHDTGSVLANLVLLTKNGRDLVRRAILLSGSALSPWAFIPDPDKAREEVSEQMACHLNGHGDGNLNASTNKKIRKEIVNNDVTDCLRTKPLEAIMGIRLPNVRFMPSWGPYLPIDDIIDPEYTMENAGPNFITMELMIGMTTTESYNDFSASDIQYGLEEEQRNRLLRTYIRNAYTFHLNEIFSAVRNEYTDWDKPIQHPINIRDSTMEALSDGHTVAPLIKVGYLHSRRGAKTYLFHFGYQTKDSEYPQRLGSVRGEDLPYIFGLPLVQGVPNFPQNYSRQDIGVAEAVLNFVTNFCKTGDPNDPGKQQQAIVHPDYGSTKERTRYRDITWETYETTTQQYLSITLKPKMKSHYRGHKIAVWLNLIPQLHRPGDPDVSMRHHHFREREPEYYAGSVRAESFTRPKQIYQNGIINNVQESRQEPYGPECTSDPTFGEALQDTEEPLNSDDDEIDEDELLDRLATRHFYSYTAALGVTVGVGCLLLILNILIFAGIYYTRDKSRRKSENDSQPASNNSLNSEIGTPIDVDIPLTSRPDSCTSPNKKDQMDPPPSYNTLQRSPCSHRDDLHSQHHNNFNKQQSHHHHHHHRHHSQTGLQMNTLPHQPKTGLSLSTIETNAYLTNCSTLPHHSSQTMNRNIPYTVPPPMPPLRTSSNPSPQPLPNVCVGDIEMSTPQQTDLLLHNNQLMMKHHHHQQSLSPNQQQQQHPQPILHNSGNSNSSGTSTLKKRVQIQEITV